MIGGEELAQELILLVGRDRASPPPATHLDAGSTI
jgi:hypothetical protein